MMLNKKSFIPFAKKKLNFFPFMDLPMVENSYIRCLSLSPYSFNKCYVLFPCPSF